MRNEYYIILIFVFYAYICQRANTVMLDNTVCKFHYRRDFMISAIRCGEKNYIYISIGIDFRLNEL